MRRSTIYLAVSIAFLFGAPHAIAQDASEYITDRTGGDELLYPGPDSELPSSTELLKALNDFWLEDDELASRVDEITAAAGRQGIVGAAELEDLEEKIQDGLVTQLAAGTRGTDGVKFIILKVSDLKFPTPAGKRPIRCRLFAGLAPWMTNPNVYSMASLRIWEEDVSWCARNRPMLIAGFLRQFVTLLENPFYSSKDAIYNVIRLGLAAIGELPVGDPFSIAFATALNAEMGRALAAEHTRPPPAQAPRFTIEALLGHFPRWHRDFSSSYFSKWNSAFLSGGVITTLRDLFSSPTSSLKDSSMYAFRDIIKSSLPENVIILVADEMLRQFVQTDARLVPESCLGTLPDISLTPEEKWLLVLEDHIRSFAKGQESFSCSISERLQAIIDDADNPDARLKQNARVLKRGIERDQEGNR